MWPSTRASTRADDLSEFLCLRARARTHTLTHRIPQNRLSLLFEYDVFIFYNITLICVHAFECARVRARSINQTTNQRKKNTRKELETRARSCQSAMLSEETARTQHKKKQNNNACSHTCARRPGPRTTPHTHTHDGRNQTKKTWSLTSQKITLYINTYHQGAHASFAVAHSGIILISA